MPLYELVLIQKLGNASITQDLTFQVSKAILRKGGNLRNV